MSAPVPPAPDAPHSPAMRYLGWLAAGLLVIAAAGAAAWGVVEWRLGQEAGAAASARGALAEELAGLRREQAQKLDELNARVARVEQAAADARLLVDGDTLSQKLAEIGQLKAELDRERQANAERAQNLEKSLKEQIGAQGQQTAVAVAAELKFRSLLLRAHGQVLKAKVDLAEGNRGLAKEELNLAGQTLKEAMDQAPEKARLELESVAGVLEQARSALILESGSARAQLDVLWQRLTQALG